MSGMPDYRYYVDGSHILSSLKYQSILATLCFAGLLLFSTITFAVEQGSDPGANKIDDAIAAYSRGDYMAAREIWIRAAAADNPAAQYNLGQLYRLGRGVNIDYQQARDWYIKSARQGHPLAQRNLGTLYYFGKLGARDFDQAFTWLLLAAIHNDAEAQWTVGVMLYNGEGVEKNLVNAYSWLTLASEQNQRDAIADRKKLEPLLNDLQKKEARRLTWSFRKTPEKVDYTSVVSESRTTNTVATSASPTYSVQVGAYQSPGNAKVALARFRQIMPDLLGGVHGQIEPTSLSSSRQTLYRLQLGSFVKRQDAKTLCYKLGKKNHDCAVVKTKPP